MNLRSFTMLFDSALGRFDDSEILDFQKDNEILEFWEHMVQTATGPAWALLVRHRPRLEHAKKKSERKSRQQDWRVSLEPADRPLYDRLRSWRNQRARSEGKPAFLLLTNRHIAEIVKRRPTSEAELREIKGVGEARVASVGQEVLALIKSSGDDGEAQEDDAGESRG